MEVHERVVYAFRGFRVDAQERLLTYIDRSVPLTPKAFDLLLLLVRNAGRLVDKDILLRELWNDVHVEEGNLAKHISMLRRALHEAAGSADCIETIPKIGYRFVAAVDKLPAETLAIPSSAPLTQMPNTSRQLQAQRLVTKPSIIVGSIFLIALAALLTWMAAQAPAPQVVGTDRLTRTSRAYWTQRILTDGVRLYFGQRKGGREVLASVPMDGGDPVVIPTPFSGSTNLLDISRDHTKLLLASTEGLPEFEQIGNEPALWTMPTAGGSPQRLGTLTGADAAWFPDGRRILFTRGSDIFSANADGSNAKRISTVNGGAKRFQWSPDGQILRFTVENLDTGGLSIWEADADGAHAHPWSVAHTAPKPGWQQGESSGVWTPDGRYFIYKSRRDTTATLWAIREQAGLRGSFTSKPILLYVFPSNIAYANLLVSPDGKHIFFVAEQEDRELMRYDQPSRHFVSYLDGIPARMVSFSRRDKWVAYYSYDYHLWRSRVDGSDRLQLTFSPLAAGPPRWSPDGASIAFRGDLSSDRFGIYLISPEGGSLRVITPAEFTRASAPCWFPDGRSLIFGEMPPVAYKVPGPPHPMQRVDLETGILTALPNSEGLNAQDLSPNGKDIVAFAQNDSRMVLYNLASHRITELSRGKSFYAAFWSRDGRYVFYQDLYAGAEQPICRIRISDRKIEPIAGLSQFNPADAMAFSFAGLTPDGSPLASVILNRGDVYSISVDFH